MIHARARHLIAAGLILCLSRWAGAEPPEAAGKQPKEMKKLLSLPYLSWSSVGDAVNKSGVTRYDRERACPGANLYTSLTRREAYLIDMEGNRLHVWKQPWKTLSGSWIFAEPLENGDLAVILRDNGVLLLDGNSWVKAAIPCRAHHDLYVGPDGLLYIVYRKEEIFTYRGEELPVLADYIGVFSPEGKMIEEFSLLDLMKGMLTDKNLREVREWSERAGKLKQLKAPGKKRRITLSKDSPADIFHTNSIEMIGHDIPGVAAKGDFLVSVRNLDLIAVIDLRKRAVRWSWGPGVISRQHHPSLISNDHILLFDNGCVTKKSRVIELDPRKRAIVWEYDGPDSGAFYSGWGGSCQKLANGDILVTDTVHGRAFELTPGKEIVWDYYNPHTRKKEKKREAIYRMIRVGNDYINSLTEKARKRSASAQ